MIKLIKTPVDSNHTQLPDNEEYLQKHYSNEEKKVK